MTKWRRIWCFICYFYHSGQPKKIMGNVVWLHFSACFMAVLYQQNTNFLSKLCTECSLLQHITTNISLLVMILTQAQTFSFLLVIMIFVVCAHVVNTIMPTWHQGSSSLVACRLLWQHSLSLNSDLTISSVETVSSCQIQHYWWLSTISKIVVLALVALCANSKHFPLSSRLPEPELMNVTDITAG